MLAFNIYPVGMTQALATLNAIGPAAEKGGLEALEELAPKIVERAKTYAPVRDGNLRDSITWRKEKGAIVIYADVPYAYWQEFGFTHYISGKWVPGKYYITKAIADFIETGEADKKVADNIQKEVAKAQTASHLAGSIGLLPILGLLFSSLMAGAMILSTRN
jgi:hypothetical protein